MKLIIAGPRDLYPSYPQVMKALEESGFEATVIISGGAKGVDTQAIKLARYRPLKLQLIVVEAMWQHFGKAAGHIRNSLMAQIADALLVIKRKGVNTAGTNNMMKQAVEMNLEVFVYEI